RVGTGGVLASHLRYKPAAVLPSGARWATQSLKPPYDWESPLDEAELSAIASLARLLSREVGHPVDLMCLVRVGGARGQPGLLPFHFTLTTASSQPTAGLEPADDIFVVSDRRSLTEASQEAPHMILVEPDAESLRDTSFLRAVGRWAADSSVPIM